MDDNNLVPTASSSSPEASVETISPTLDWALFGVTAVGAAIVYIALFNESWIGFIVGEVICGSVWLGGYFYKRHRARKAKTACRQANRDDANPPPR